MKLANLQLKSGGPDKGSKSRIDYIASVTVTNDDGEPKHEQVLFTVAAIDNRGQAVSDTAFANTDQGGVATAAFRELGNWQLEGAGAVLCARAIAGHMYLARGVFSL